MGGGGGIHSRHVELPTVEEVMEKAGIAEENLFDSVPSCSVEWLVYLAKIWRIDEFLQKEPQKWGLGRRVMGRTICFVRDADECVAELERDEVVFCTGSLYLCGDLLNAVKWTESCVC